MNAVESGPSKAPGLSWHRIWTDRLKGVVNCGMGLLLLVAHRCLVCSGLVAFDQACNACPLCSARYHLDCWQYTGRCSRYGCQWYQTPTAWELLKWSRYSPSEVERMDAASAPPSGIPRRDSDSTSFILIDDLRVTAFGIVLLSGFIFGPLLLGCGASMPPTCHRVGVVAADWGDSLCSMGFAWFALSGLIGAPVAIAASFAAWIWSVCGRMLK